MTSRGDVIVRPAIPDDAAAVRELRLDALARHPEAFAADHDLTQAESALHWVDWIADNAAQNRGMIAVAVAEERLVGMTGLVRGKWPKTRHSGTIWGVYVRPAWRGLRVAEALLDTCIEWAREQGLTIVKLGVVTGNVAAIRCYARAGFTVYGVEPQVIHHVGVLHDELLMAKTI
jgi:RimJ/RimL family protein N-acetyltransferase